MSKIQKLKLEYYSIPLCNTFFSFFKIWLISMLVINTNHIAQIENISLISEIFSFALISPLFAKFKIGDKNLNSNLFIKSFCLFGSFIGIINVFLPQIEMLLYLSDMTLFLRVATVSFLCNFILTFLQTLVCVELPDKLIKLSILKTSVAVITAAIFYTYFGEFGVLYAEIVATLIVTSVYAGICIKKELFEIFNFKNIKADVGISSSTALLQTTADTIAVVFFLKAYINKISFAGDFWLMNSIFSSACLLIINGYCEKMKSINVGCIKKSTITSIFKTIFLVVLLMPVWLFIGQLLGLPERLKGLFVIFVIINIPKMITSVFHAWFISNGKQEYTIAPAFTNLISHAFVFSFLGTQSIAFFLFIYGGILIVQMVAMIISYMFLQKKIVIKSKI